MAQSSVRRIEDRRVGEIDELGSKLDPPVGADWKILLEAEVRCLETRSTHRAHTAIAKGPRRWRFEWRSIKPLESAVRSIPARSIDPDGPVQLPENPVIRFRRRRRRLS